MPGLAVVVGLVPPLAVMCALGVEAILERRLRHLPRIRPALRLLWQHVGDWLDRRAFPAIVAYATHRLHILALLAVLAVLMLDSDPIVQLKLGNYTNVTSAAVACIVLLQQMAQHREVKRLHREHREQLDELHQLLRERDARGRFVRKGGQ